MSDAPGGPGWWCASDGRWYPPPYPTFDDGYPSQPPTPAPDHPPTGVPDGASAFPEYSLAPHPTRTRSKALWAVSAVAIVLAIAVVALSLALVGRGPGNFRTASKQYDVAIADVVDAESTNIAFVDTFWQSYSSYLAQWKAASADRRPALTQQFLEELDTEIEQFRLDLRGIDGTLVSRSFDSGSDADRVRDAAVAHYRSWDEWASAVPNEARAWTSAASGTSLNNWIDTNDPELSDTITTTFHTVCSTLADTQPSDGSYEDTIMQICSE